jgi:transposase
LFEQGVQPPEVARCLRVSRKSAYAWYARWRDGGVEALVSKGSQGPRCRLDASQLARLEDELERGPAVHGWAEDQRWTLARIVVLVHRLFKVSYSLKGMSLVLHRIGWSVQVPVHRAVERDEAVVTAWREGTWPEVGKRHGTRARGWSSRTRPVSR